MHTLLGLSSVLLVVLGGSLALGILCRSDGWAQRRELQFLVLAAPVVSLGLGIGGLHHFAGQVCFLGAPPWDYTLGVALPLGMGLVALAALGLGLARLVLMDRLVRHKGWRADPDLQGLASRLAERVGVAPPRLLVCAYDRPLALACGLFSPTLLLSTWMVERLDQRELESVLAHELGHVARRDYLMVWLATVLRDAFFYLPTSWAAYRQLQREKEVACDDLAIAATNRPLALASALAKVWEQAVGRRTVAIAQSLVGAGGAIEGRIERLLAGPVPAAPASRSRSIAVGIGSLALVGLLMLEGVNVVVMLTPMGCGPASPLRTLF